MTIISVFLSWFLIPSETAIWVSVELFFGSILLASLLNAAAWLFVLDFIPSIPSTDNVVLVGSSIGGIIGAVLGSLIWGGIGGTIATTTGIVLGSGIGNNVGDANRPVKMRKAEMRYGPFGLVDVVLPLLMGSALYIVFGIHLRPFEDRFSSLVFSLVGVVIGIAIVRYFVAFFGRANLFDLTGTIGSSFGALSGGIGGVLASIILATTDSTLTIPLAIGVGVTIGILIVKSLRGHIRYG